MRFLWLLPGLISLAACSGDAEFRRDLERATLESFWHIDSGPEDSEFEGRAVHEAGPRTSTQMQNDMRRLRKAYSRWDGIYHTGSKIYIAGTRNSHDWDQNVRVLPSLNSEEEAGYNARLYHTRYRAAEEKYSDILDRGGTVHLLVGHSMGGAVAEALARQLNVRGHVVRSVVYNGPVRGAIDASMLRLRTRFDPVSLLGTASTMTTLPTSTPFVFPRSAHGFNALQSAVDERRRRERSASRRGRRERSEARRDRRSRSRSRVRRW